MDLNLIVENSIVKPIHCDADTKVPLHLHDAQDEIFYCVNGSGFGITEDGEVPLNVGEAFIARAGVLHSLRTDSVLDITAFMVPVDRVICTDKEIKYSAIRKAMVGGARTVEELQKATGVCTTCSGCVKDVERILASACGCKNVSVETVVTAVKDGADTLEKVQEVTGAGDGCGKCKFLLQNIIDTKR